MIDTGIPGDDSVRRAAGHEGLRPEQDVLLAQRRGESGGISPRRGCVSRQVRLTDEQRQAVKHRNVLELLHAGGNIYYLAKFSGVFGLNVQQFGAQQRGMTEQAFKDMLVRGAAGAGGKP